MQILLLKHTSLVHVWSLMRSALHGKGRRSKQCTKQTGGTIRSPVAMDSRQRWSSSVSFPLSATLMSSVAAEMTTIMTSLRRSHADLLLIWMRRTIATQGKHHKRGLSLPLLLPILLAACSLRRRRGVKQSKPQDRRARATAHVTGHVKTTTGDEKC